MATTCPAGTLAVSWPWRCRGQSRYRQSRYRQSWLAVVLLSGRERQLRVGQVTVFVVEVVGVHPRAGADPRGAARSRLGGGGSDDLRAAAHGSDRGPRRRGFRHPHDLDGRTRGKGQVARAPVEQVQRQTFARRTDCERSQKASTVLSTPAEAITTGWAGRVSHAAVGRRSGCTTGGFGGTASPVQVPGSPARGGGQSCLPAEGSTNR